MLELTKSKYGLLTGLLKVRELRWLAKSLLAGCLVQPAVSDAQQFKMPSDNTLSDQLVFEDQMRQLNKLTMVQSEYDALFAEIFKSRRIAGWICYLTQVVPDSSTMRNCVWKEADGSCPSMYLVLCNHNHVTYYLVLDKSKDSAKLFRNSPNSWIRFKGELRALPDWHVPVPVVKLEFD